MQKCFLLTVRGLEGVCAAEAAEVPGLNVQKIEYRRIMLETARPEDLLQLRTADDAFLFLGSLNGLDKQRSGLAQLAGWCRTLAFQPAACFLGKPGLANVAPVFSVSASFVGKRNYTSEEIKQTVAGAISDLTGWQNGREDEGGVHLRLFIDRS